MTGFTAALKWVRLKKYCELSGDTEDAVHARRRKGQWINNRQCRLAPDHRVWVNLIEVEKWVEQSPTMVNPREFPPALRQGNGKIPPPFV